MKPNISLIPGAALLAALLLAAGCSTPPRPVVHYPVTYDVPVGNTQVRASTGPQDLDVSSTQRVEVKPGEPLYYRIASPVAVSVSVYERRSPDSARVLLREMRGTAFTASVTPAARSLEFVFAAEEPNSGGTLRFTLSDRPLAPAVEP